jgi:hypothetical protein
MLRYQVQSGVQGVERLNLVSDCTANSVAFRRPCGARLQAPEIWPQYREQV